MPTKETIFKTFILAIGISIIALLIIIAVLLRDIDYHLFDLKNITLANQPGSQKPVPQPTDLDEDDDPFIGSSSARVSIILFSDYECSFCVKYYNEIYKDLYTDYIEPETVKLVFRDFPLESHDNAIAAASAAECAENQGQFKAMFEYIFEHQKELKNNSPEMWARAIGLDIEEFNKCMNSAEILSEIEDDIEDGKNAGIFGTPSFVIDGMLYIGIRPYDEFKKLVDAAVFRNEIVISIKKTYDILTSDNKNMIFLDVRTPLEFSNGHIPGSKNIDIMSEDFSKQLKKLEKDYNFILYCKGNSRSMMAAEKMKALGFKSFFQLDGGFTAWQAADYPIEEED